MPKKHDKAQNSGEKAIRTVLKIVINPQESTNVAYVNEKLLNCENRQKPALAQVHVLAKNSHVRSQCASFQFRNRSKRSPDVIKFIGNCNFTAFFWAVNKET